MERIVDKIIVLACCASALVLMGTSFMSVSALLAAVLCAFAAEMISRRFRIVLGIVYCVLACAVPPAAAFTASATYDLVQRSPALIVIAILPAFAALLMGSLVPAVPACSLLACAIAAVLALRTTRALAMRQNNLQLADELRERELKLEARNRELLDAQDYEVQLATLAERARIARDIHDNVGHLITRATVQTEALRVVHAGEAVSDELGSVTETLREALEEVRSSVHNLRDDSTDLSVQVRAVVEDACADTAVTASVQVEAGEAPAPVAACLTAVVREAISNTLRHAHASNVQVNLVEYPGLWRLTVSDDGTGCDGGVRFGDGACPGDGGSRPGDAVGLSTGMGLASMEERVRALGGTFKAGPGARGGWTVFASVPKAGGRPA